jgi:FKBP-type peptidyl-prolyl cis-trans isomerase FkpA
MKFTRFLCPLLIAALPVAAADQKPAANAKGEQKPAAVSAPSTPAETPALDPAEKEKVLYALGQAIARNLGAFALSEEELKAVEEGMTDGVLEHPAKVDAEEYMPKVQALARERAPIARERMAAAAAKVAGPNKKAGAEFAEKAAAEPGAVKKESGLIYKEITPGAGESPKATDRVKVNYTGTLIDGTVFDSSVERGKPAEFPLNGVIPCWTEGVQMMKVGGKARLVCPSSIAYGDNGAGPKIKPGSTLVFEVELLAIEPPPAMPAGHPAMEPKPEPKPEAKPETK